MEMESGIDGCLHTQWVALQKKNTKFGEFTTFIQSGSKPDPCKDITSALMIDHPIPPLKMTWIKSSQYLAFLAYPAGISREIQGPQQTVPLQQERQ